MRFLLDFKYGVFCTVIFLLLWHQLVTAQATNPGTPPSSSPKLDAKMVGVMVLVVLVFLILGFLSVYSRQRAHKPLGARERMTNLGLDRAVIESFPAFLFSDVKGIHLRNDPLQCAVCLNDISDDETLRLIPKCNHVFHSECIDTWLFSHSTCPVFRAYLVPKPGEEPYHSLILLIDQETARLEPEDLAADAKLPRDVSVRVVEDQIKEEEGTPKINLISVSDQCLPARSRSTGFRPPRSPRQRFAEILFPRSQSTGHNLLVQPGVSTEKFTLRLPEEVRARLMNMALMRAKSVGVFRRAGSARQG